MSSKQAKTLELALAQDDEEKDIKVPSSFRARVLVLFCGILLISQSLFFVIYDHLNTENAHKVVLSGLDTTLNVFERLLNDRFERLTSAVQLLSADFGFRSAIAMAEKDTLYSMMGNHARRVGADVMFAFDTSGKLTATYPAMTPDAVVDAFNPVFAASGVEKRIGDRLFSMIVLDGKPYQIVIVPIKAPQLIAYAAVGFVLTNDFAKSIKDITAAEVSFVYQNAGDTNLLISTNITPASVKSLTSQLKTGQGDKTAFSVFLNNEEYITYMVPLFDMGAQKFYAIMQSPWEQALKPFTRYRPILMGITLTFLIVSVVVSTLLARQVTRPIMLLVDAVRKVEKGNYDYVLKIERQDEIGVLTVGFNRMVEGLAERDQMKYMALHDGLTGLPNRRRFNDVVENAIRLQEEGGGVSAVLLIDLDGFKPINDNYGHAAGDAVLKYVGSRLSLGSIREQDIAARLGGDEFAVLYLGLSDIEVVKRKAGELLAKLNEPMQVEDRVVHVGASMGIAMTHPGISAVEWLEKADHACYVSKRHGKNAFSVEGQEPVTLQQVLALAAQQPPQA